MLISVRLRVFFFMIHNSYLVCMVGITYVYINMIFAFYGYVDLFSGFCFLGFFCLFVCFVLFCFFFFFFFTYLYCLAGCMSMIFSTHAVLGCLISMCFTFLYLYLFKAVEHVLHGQAL